jgi:DNA-binding PadR family transcriptional regulator
MVRSPVPQAVRLGVVVVGVAVVVGAGAAGLAVAGAPQAASTTSTAAAATSRYVEFDIPVAYRYVAASTLGFALLGLLARRPRTGYELAQALREPIGYFWTASHSQIYPELAKLETQRHVRHRVVRNPGPREGKLYSITTAGRRALADWAVTDPADAIRDEFLLRVYSLWTADPAEAMRMLARRRAAHSARLVELEGIESRFTAAPTNPSDPDFSAYATLRRGVSFERHAIEWCDWMLTTLSASGYVDDPIDEGEDT